MKGRRDKERGRKRVARTSGKVTKINRRAGKKSLEEWKKAKSEVRKEQNRKIITHSVVVKRIKLFGSKINIP